MPSGWFISLKRFMCKSKLSNVHDPKPKVNSSETRKPSSCRSSWCSASIFNLMHRIHGSKRHTVDNSDFTEPKVHADPPGVQHPSDCQTELVNSGRRSFSILGSRRISLVCEKCGEKLENFETIEAHNLSRHTVTALPEGDSSKKIVELICQKSFPESENKFGHILKVHNMQRTLAPFEDFKEMVKIKAKKISEKHPRCLADGNELLRFYGTVVACSLGTKSASKLCKSEKCGVCQILRNGFFTKKESNGSRGVLTSSTSRRAFECIELDEQNLNLRKALVVCRVIAERVHKSLENLQEMEGQSSFDSLAGKADCHSNIEELCSLNPRALLPCFVVICKPSNRSAQIIT